ncbi:MAG TPA: M20 family peptidase [Steroidobacteraceae bacterium]|nr:M20 family peptidase [Steroidobacteraceae bacterium]
MRLALRIVLAVIATLVLVTAIVIVRTVTYRAPSPATSDVELASAPPIDLARAASHLAEAVRILTISHQDAAANDPREWDRLHGWLQSTYPVAHAAMSRTVVAGHSLVYTWRGSDRSLPAIILMAHQDVVPVTPGTEGDWKHPPYGGIVADGAVWGRGTVDDKGSLVATFEAVEALASAGFVPRRTLIVVSGHDEEAGGTGAQAAAQWLQSQGVRAEFALDEGLAVVADLPIVSQPAALIGVAEKGYATLRVTAPAKGGHSSAPPRETGVETLARAVLAITGRPFPLEFEGPAADMVRDLAPRAGWPVRMAVANEWLFRPLLVRQLASTPAGAASLHTTIAPTMLRGSPKENVLPQDAAAWINYRIAPQDTAARVMDRARQATQGLDVRLEWVGPAYDPSPVSSSTSDAYRLLAALASEEGTRPVAPALVNATTDSRHMRELAADVYRFQPIVASLRDFEMVHGTNEHMTLDNLRRLCEFYARLIATGAAR